MYRIFILSLCYLMSSCDSPMNHRARFDDSEKSRQTLAFSSQPLNVETQWLSDPFGNAKQQSALLVFITDEQGALTDIPEGLSLNFYADMPSMGHPMDDAGAFQKLETGIFLNKTIRFNMAGDWRMELRLQDEEFNITDQVQWYEFL